MDPNQDRAVQAAFDGYVPASELSAALAEIERLQALLAAAPSAPSVGWRPIDGDTPRDGTPILARNSRHPSHAPVVVRWMIGDCEPYWCDAATPIGDALYFNGNYFDRWMPVPVDSLSTSEPSND